MTALYLALLTFTAPLRTRLRSDRGIEAIEYALIAALVAAIIVAAFALIQGPAGPVQAIFQAIANQLTTAAGNVN
ncbi:MAG TPA: Flp family type IVb pilin [Euzebyales bacterium]